MRSHDPRKKTNAPRQRTKAPRTGVDVQGPVAGPASAATPPPASADLAERDRLLASHGAGLEDFSRFFPLLFYRFSVSPDDRFSVSQVSPSADAVTGYAAQEILSDAALLTGRVHPDDAAAWRKMLDWREHNAEWTQAIRYRHREGRFISVRVLSRHVFGTDGGMEGLACWVDISSGTEEDSLLADREQQHRFIVENSIQGMAITQDKTIREANRAFADIFGYSGPAELIGKSSLELWAPHEHARMLDYWNARREGREAPERYEFEGVRKDGSPVWLDNQVRSIPWNGGRGTLFLVLDVTERKLAEQRIRASEERYRALVEESIQGMVVVKDGEIRLANMALARMFGYDRPEDLVGKSNSILWAPHEHERIQHYREARLRGAPAPEHYEFEGRKRDGSAVWVENRVSLIPWEGGVASQGMMLDITARRQTELELRTSERQYRELVESSLEGIAVVQDGIYQFVNRTFCDIFGYSDPLELIGTPSEQRWAEHERPRMRGYREARLRGESIPERYDFEGLRRDGSTVYAEHRIRIIPWNGRPASLALLVDLSARRLAELQLRESEARYRELIVQSLQGMQVIQDGKIVFANATEAQIFGYGSKDELLGLRTRDLLAPEEMPGVLSKGPALEQGEVVGFPQQRGIRKDGSSVWVQAAVARIRWQGRVAYQVFHTDVTGRVLAERALRESETRFRDLVEGSLQGIFIHRDFHILFANQAFAQMCGLDTPGQVLESGDILSFVAPHERARIRGYGEARQKGLMAPRRFEVQGARADGKELWMEVESRRVDWNGEPAIQSTVFDITERRLAQEELGASRKRYRDLVETSLQGMSVVRNDRIVFANPAEARTFGFSSPEEMVGVDIKDLVDPVEVPELEQRRNILLSGGSIDFVERRGRRRDGSLVWLRVSATLIPWEGGAAIQVVHSDITERKLAEQALIDSEARFRDLVEGSLQGILIHRDSKLLFVNQALADIYGYDSPEAMLALGDGTLLVATEDRHLVVAYAAARARGEPAPTRYEIRGRRKNGDPVWVEVESRRVTWQGQPAIQSTIVDITERKRAEQAVLESELRYRELVEGTLHGIAVMQDNRVVFGNRAEASIFGFDSPEEMVGLDLRTLIDESAQASIEERRQAVLRGEPVPLIERRARRRDGSPIWVQSGVTLTRWQGRPAFQVFHADVTSLKLAEQARLETEHRYRELVENSLQGMAVIQDDRIVFANPAEARIFGYESAAAMERLPAENLMAPEEVANIHARRQALARGETVPFVEQRGLRKDGSPVWIQAGVALIQWRGRPAYQAFHTDITEQKLAEQALRDNEALLRAILDNAPALIYIKDAAARYLLLNRAYERSTGISQVRARGRTARDIFPPETADSFAAHDLEVMSRKEPVLYEEAVELKGSRKDFLTMRFPVLDASGGIIAVGGISTDITERKAAEQALRESEARYRTIVENTLQGIVVADFEGRIISANNRLAEMFGYSNVDELAARRLDELVAGRDLARFQGRRARRSRGESVEPYFEFQGVRADGQPIWIGQIWALVNWEGARAILGMWIDITERKRAEEALRESEQHYRDLVEASIQGILIRDHDRIVFANQAMADILGFESVKALLDYGDPIGVFAPEDQERIRQYAQARFAGEPAPAHYECAVIRQDGERIWVENQSRRVVWKSKPAIQVILYDITERRRAEEAIRESQGYLSAVLDTAADGIVTIGRDGIVESFNREAERIFGYSADELVGNSLSLLLPDEHRDKLQGYLRHYFETGESQVISLGRETFARRKDGSVFPVSVSVSEVRIGNRLSFSAIVKDITERKQQEQELIETARAKSVLLSSLSHELRTPLTAILGFVQLLRREAELTSVQREDIETIEQSAHHLLELINDVLEVQKMEAGYIKLNREDFDLHHTMESLVAMFLPRAEGKRLALQLSIAKDVPRYVHGDARRLRQVLINLLSNAVNFTDRGSITLSLSRDGGQTRFSVRDTGRGIAQAELPGLMRPFRQAAITHEGTGLGLSISKGLAEIMGGNLEVASELGAGSEFHFAIPLPDLNERDPESQISDSAQDDQVPLRILVVEDDARLREWLLRLLRGEGFIVDQASDGREALQRFATSRPDLIVTDLKMPVMDGVEFAQRVRATPGGAELGILALSAELESRQFGGSEGLACFDRILAKPISADELLDVLHVHVSRVRAESGSLRPPTLRRPHGA